MPELRRAGTTYPPSRSLVLCAAPRTGSTLLCELLTGTDVLGYPKEPFAPASLAACAEAWGTPEPDVDPGAYLRAALRNGTSPDGTFATKIMWEHLDELRRWGARQSRAEVLSLFPRPHALLVTRRDKVAAAVSWVRARSTGTWSRSPGGRNPRPPTLDLDGITAAHRAQHAAEESWRALLAELPTVPTATLVYEDVAADHAAAVATAAGLLGREVAGPPPRPTLTMQRDRWTTEVVARWTAATGGCATCAVPAASP
ncbi:Stf0 family sulfotransferase [Iamia majanohamensis]|uniref:Trehalose 2-sulfotransferase n=1 Tax=Iamia majanohamensis TaxID=467976 RepID=A0AAE9Y9G0_9ACTN|nr:Stf0 family sulfotransferase [Iamia majanohamensis]WCO68236.1 Stf0 family sulfotransferase [Iamia majanohamensis]